MCTRTRSPSRSCPPRPTYRPASTRLSNELPALKKWLARLGRDGELRACYEASGAGYVLHRALQEWGYACEVIAPSLIPQRAGVQRKHDQRDAIDLARLYRAGELVAVRIPSEAEERVRDVVRCREIVQREILKSRHDILKFLARRGFVCRDGTNWCTPHLQGLQHLTTDGAPLGPDDRLIYREFHALLMYKLQRREDLDRQIERLAELPTLAPMVGVPGYNGPSARDRRRGKELVVIGLFADAFGERRNVEYRRVHRDKSDRRAQRSLARVCERERCQAVHAVCEGRRSANVPGAKGSADIVQFRGVADREGRRPRSRIVEQFDADLRSKIAFAHELRGQFHPHRLRRNVSSH